LIYWLREDSPARGKGSSKYAPVKDFWGRSYPENQPIDIGAFPSDISHIHLEPYFMWVKEEDIMKMLANQGSVETNTHNIQTNTYLVSEPSSV